MQSEYFFCKFVKNNFIMFKGGILKLSLGLAGMVCALSKEQQDKAVVALGCADKKRKGGGGVGGYKADGSDMEESPEVVVINDSPYFVGGGAGNAAAPLPEDYITVPFRALSATVVAANTWRAVEFPVDVLAAAVPKLENKTAFSEHWHSTGNTVGKAKNSRLSPAGQQGTIAVPAGIDIDLVIDAVNNFELCRRVLNKEVYSVSVTVLFEWKPSHEFEKEWQFNEAVGTVVNGEMVRRIATKIIDIYEVSLVWMGADPFAKMINPDGTLENIDVANVYKANAAFSKFWEPIETAANAGQPKGETAPAITEILAAYALPVELPRVFILEASKTPNQQPPANNQQQPPAQNKELERLLLALKTGFDLDKVTPESIAAAVAQQKQKAAELTAELTNANTNAAQSAARVLELEKELQAAKTGAENWAGYIGRKRSEAVALYKQSTPTPNAGILALLEKANETEIEALLGEYCKKAAERFNFKCGKCGSNEYTVKSSLTVDDDNTGVKETETPATEPAAPVGSMHRTPKKRGE